MSAVAESVCPSLGGACRERLKHPQHSFVRLGGYKDLQSCRGVSIPKARRHYLTFHLDRGGLVLTQASRPNANGN